MPKTKKTVNVNFSRNVEQLECTDIAVVANYGGTILKNLRNRTNEHGG